MRKISQLAIFPNFLHFVPQTSHNPDVIRHNAWAQKIYNVIPSFLFIMEMIIEQSTELGKDALENSKKYNGFLGVSILHKFFSKKNMKFYFDWCSKQFDEFVIILMDDPDKYNFQIFKNMNEKDALEHARKISDELKRGYEKVLRDLDISNIKILQLRDLIKDKKYVAILQEVNNYFESNKEFAKDLNKLMDIGIGGKIEELPYDKKEIEEKRRILINYIIEELASILYLTENHYPIELDPTIEFTTKKRIYERDFPELYTKLKLTKRGHIFIHPKGI